METGFAAATRAILDTLVPDAAQAGTVPGRRPRQVNVLAGSHLTDTDFSPLTIGGTPLNELETLGDAHATLVIGASMNAAADLLRERTGVEDYRFDHLMGLEATDALIHALQQLSGVDVPDKLVRQRAQLQDAMLDTHFMLGLSRIAIAAHADLLNGFSQLLSGMGAATVAAVAPANAPVLQRVAAEQLKIGDLEDLRLLAVEHRAELLIGNSHAADSAAQLGIPLLRAGFPQYDLLGGYQGTRQTLFELANLLLSLERGETHPYRSVYACKPDYREVSDAAAAPPETNRLRH